MKKYASPAFLLTIIFLLLITLITANAQGQTSDEHLKVYDNATLHAIGKYYIKGTERISFRALKNEFYSVSTKELYTKAKADRALGGLLSVTAVSALITGIIVRKNNTTLGNTLSGAAIVLNLGGLHLSNRSNKLTDQAIWLRNREILFGITQ